MLFDVNQNSNIVFIVFTALLVSFTTLAVLLYERVFRGRAGNLIKIFLVLVFLIVFWTYTYLLELIAIDQSTYVLITKIQHFSIVFIGVVWLSLALVYSGYENFFKKYIYFLVIPPIISLILVWTNDYHYLFYSKISLYSDYQWGPLWWFPHTIINYLYIIIGLILFARYFYITEGRTEKIKSAIVLVGALLPFLGNILYVTVIKDYLPYKIDSTTILFSLTNILFMYGLFRYRLFENNPIFFDEIMKSISSGIIIMDKNKKVVMINDAGINLIKKDNEKLNKKYLEKVWTTWLGNYKEKLFLMLADLDKKVVAVSKDLFCFGGSNKRCVSFTLSVVRDRNNQNIGYLIVMKDISDQIMRQRQIEDSNRALKIEKINYENANRELSVSKKALINIMEDMKTTSKDLSLANKKYKEVDEMRKKFVSLTAHELRNPLNLYRWTLEMLINEDVGKINGNQRELINQMYQSNKRLLSMVDDLLEMSRIDQKKFTVEIKKCDLADLIDQVLGENAIKIRQKKLKVNWTKPKKRLIVSADCDRIIQVLDNIISNAEKYSKENNNIDIGCVEVSQIAPLSVMLKQNLKSTKTKYIKCTIKDYGIGIPKSEQGKMFGRFFRASNAMENKIPGNGLGMTIAKEIINLHGGAMWFTSAKDKGTTFHFTIPIAK